MRLPRSTMALAGGPGTGTENTAIANPMTTFFGGPRHPQQQQQQQQSLHVFYACPMNNMCQCAGYPNETTTLVVINCSEIDLYKFPGK